MSADLSALLKGGALLLVALVAGWAIGAAVGASPDATDASAGPSSASQTASPEPATLPAADVPGRDFQRLPRYPGAVRSAFEDTTSGQYQLLAAEYLVDATIEDVRGFYQSVIGQHGWQRADIGYEDGEWTYILVDGRIEALIEIEMRNGLVEIDLQVSLPISTPTPSPEPTARPQSPTQRPAPPPSDGDDDDGDDDDGDDDDASDDDDVSDDD